jgi:hypothetical protein
MRDIGKRDIFSVVDDHRDEELPRPANDNYQRLDLTMKLFEPGSILDQRDYKKPDRREEFGLAVATAICALVLVVAYIVPLLK